MNFYRDDSLILLLLKSTLRACPQLERLVLIDNLSLQDSSSTRPPSVILDLEDFLVKFATDMRRLIFCCINFYRVDPAMTNKINRLIAEKVIPTRPSLWFNVDSVTPDEDPNLPFIHYLEMTSSDIYFPPPAF